MHVLNIEHFQSLYIMHIHHHVSFIIEYLIRTLGYIGYYERRDLSANLAHNQC